MVLLDIADVGQLVCCLKHPLDGQFHSPLHSLALHVILLFLEK